MTAGEAGGGGAVVERCAFVAVTTVDLDRARAFWVDAPGGTVADERAGQFLPIDLGVRRLCLAIPDGDVHHPRAPSRGATRSSA